MEKADIEFKFIKEPCNICDTKNAEKCPYSINDKVSTLMSRFWGLKSSELANNNNSIITFENNKYDLVSLFNLAKGQKNSFHYTETGNFANSFEVRFVNNKLPVSETAYNVYRVEINIEEQL